MGKDTRNTEVSPDNENNYAGLKFPHGGSACQGRQQILLKRILTITTMIKYSEFEINIWKRKNADFNVTNNSTRFLRVKE